MIENKIARKFICISISDLQNFDNKDDILKFQCNKIKSEVPSRGTYEGQLYQRQRIFQGAYHSSGSQFQGNQMESKILDLQFRHLKLLFP